MGSWGFNAGLSVLGLGLDLQHLVSLVIFISFRHTGRRTSSISSLEGVGRGKLRPLLPAPTHPCSMPSAMDPPNEDSFLAALSHLITARQKAYYVLHTCQNGASSPGHFVLNP
ncbi:hypothetical protein GGI42DRAFT_266318 [Trichoderma sp. SZMC 28013]